MTTGKMIGRLRALKTAVLEDGNVDWDETTQLLDAIRPLAAKCGFLCEDYERLLEKCRADGKVTPDESRQLALQLEFLCSSFANRRLRFWLVVAVLGLLAVSTLSLLRGIASSADASALKEQAQDPVSEIL